MEENKVIPQEAMTSFQQQDIINLQQNLVGHSEQMSVSLWTSEMLDPVALNFIPIANWQSRAQSLAVLRDIYFGKKNNVNRRFEWKLWNALRITTVYPSFDKAVGVVWMNNNIIKVYKRIFAQLLGINAVDGGLFHKQGNFPRHGFTMLSEPEARAQLTSDQLSDVDFREVLLIYNKQGRFSMSSTEDEISTNRWVNPSPQPRVASIVCPQATC